MQDMTDGDNDFLKSVRFSLLDNSVSAARACIFFLRNSENRWFISFLIHVMFPYSVWKLLFYFLKYDLNEFVMNGLWFAVVFKNIQLSIMNFLIAGTRWTVDKAVKKCKNIMFLRLCYCGQINSLRLKSWKWASKHLWGYDLFWCWWNMICIVYLFIFNLYIYVYCTYAHTYKYYISLELPFIFYIGAKYFTDSLPNFRHLC